MIRFTQFLENNKRSLRGDFIYYCAQTLFATSWADYVDAVDSNKPGRGRLSGKEVFNEMPDVIPKEAFDEAMDYTSDLEKINGKSIEDLFESAINAGGEEDIELFAHYLIMQALGHGVSWTDNNPKFPFKNTNIEFSYYNFDWPDPNPEEEGDDWDDEDDDLEGDEWKYN